MQVVEFEAQASQRVVGLLGPDSQLTVNDVVTTLASGSIIATSSFPYGTVSAGQVSDVTSQISNTPLTLQVDGVVYTSESVYSSVATTTPGAESTTSGLLIENTPKNNAQTNDGVSGGVIAGIVIGVLVVVGLVAGVAGYLMLRNRKHKKQVQTYADLDDAYEMSESNEAFVGNKTTDPHLRQRTNTMTIDEPGDSTM